MTSEEKLDEYRKGWDCFMLHMMEPIDKSLYVSDVRFGDERYAIWRKGWLAAKEWLGGVIGKYFERDFPEDVIV